MWRKYCGKLALYDPDNPAMSLSHAPEYGPDSDFDIAVVNDIALRGKEDAFKKSGIIEGITCNDVRIMSFSSKPALSLHG